MKKFFKVTKNCEENLKNIFKNLYLFQNLILIYTPISILHIHLIHRFLPYKSDLYINIYLYSYLRLHVHPYTWIFCLYIYIYIIKHSLNSHPKIPSVFIYISIVQDEIQGFAYYQDFLLLLLFRSAYLWKRLPSL